MFHELCFIRHEQLMCQLFKALEYNGFLVGKGYELRFGLNYLYGFTYIICGKRGLFDTFSKKCNKNHR